MMNTGKLAGKTIFITGASRGIGKEIALKAAKDGANVVIVAKTVEPHPKLPGTIYTAAEEVEKAGGKSLPFMADIRDEKQVQSAVDAAVKKFGGIDILINNASAISLTGTELTDMKRYDLMHSINTRGTFLVSKLCVPHLKNSSHAHILTMSPPLSMKTHWFSNHVAYTMAKYGMSMCVLGMHEEFRPLNISVNALWPRTMIQTAASDMLIGKDLSDKICRKASIMADAAYSVLTQDPKPTGQFFIDDEVLSRAGITDMVQYAVDPASIDKLVPDLFIDDISSVSNPTLDLLNKPAKATEPVKSSDKSTGAGKVAEVFKAVEKTLDQSIVEKTQAIYQFEVTGEEAGTWYLDLKTGAGKCGRGEPEQKADATLTMDSGNFSAMFSGKLKPAAAFMTGKLKIKGNMQLALKLDKLMSSLKTKL